MWRGGCRSTAVLSCSERKGPRVWAVATRGSRKWKSQVANRQRKLMTRRASGKLTPQIPLHPGLASEVRGQLPSGTTTSLFAHHGVSINHAGAEVCEICELTNHVIDQPYRFSNVLLGLGVVPSELGPGAKVPPTPKHVYTKLTKATRKTTRRRRLLEFIALVRCHTNTNSSSE